MNRTWGTYQLHWIGRRLACAALGVLMIGLAGCQQGTEQPGPDAEKKKTDEVQRIVASFGEDPGKNPIDPMPKKEGPDPDWKPNEDLPLIPRDAQAFVSVRVGDIWRSALLQNLRPKVPPALLAPIQEHEQKLGLGMNDIERVTAVALGLPAGNKEPPMAYIVAARRAIDQQKVLAEYGHADAAERKVGQLAYFPLKDGMGIRFVNKFIAVIAAPADLAKVPPPKPTPGPLEADINEAEKHTIVVAVNAANAVKTFGNEIPPNLAITRQARLASLWVDVNDTLNTSLRLGYPKPDLAKAAVGVVKKAIADGQQTFAKMPLPINDLQRQSQVRGRVDAAFNKLDIKQDKSEVVINFQLTGDDLAIIPDLFAGAINRAQDAAGRAQVTTNLKRLALALHQYQLEHNSFPAAAITKDGKPLLSWRVALLPALGEMELYKEFKLDEPWDSAHNKKLLDKMPKIYALPGQAEVGKTYLQAFSGPATMFSTTKGYNFPDIKDGAANTVAVVEAANPVEWTKPLELPYEVGKPLPPLGKLEPGTFLALFIDGTVRSVPLDEARIRAYISREGKEPIND